MLVIASKYGYLCNRIVTFANTMAFSIENGIRLFNPAFDEYGRYFNGMTRNAMACCSQKNRSLWNGDRARYLVYRLCCLPYQIHGESKTRIRTFGPLMSIDIGWRQRFLFDHSEFSVLADSIKKFPLVFLSGYYFLDETNLSKHAEKVREYFTPRPQYRERIEAILERERKVGEILIGVHIRQNDYKNFCGGVYYYTTPEYHQFLKEMVNLFPGKAVRFLICSDTQQNPADFPGVSFGFGSGHLIEDLYALAGCDYLIGPPSTFSGWASFYGQVPRMVMNQKERLKRGLAVDPPELSDFKVSSKIQDN